MGKLKLLPVMVCLFFILGDNCFAGNSRPISYFFNRKKDKKTIAAVLAFPLIGCTAAHRIYLGTQPLVPVTYTATLGGCLGILPLADLIAILASHDIEEYSNNPRVFMWIK